MIRVGPTGYNIFCRLTVWGTRIFASGGQCGPHSLVDGSCMKTLNHSIQYPCGHGMGPCRFLQFYFTKKSVYSQVKSIQAPWAIYWHIPDYQWSPVALTSSCFEEKLPCLGCIALTGSSICSCSRPGSRFIWVIKFCKLELHHVTEISRCDHLRVAHKQAAWCFCCRLQNPQYSSKFQAWNIHKQKHGMNNICNDFSIGSNLFTKAWQHNKLRCNLNSSPINRASGAHNSNTH